MIAVFRAFSHRNFRLYFTGQLISMVGSWIQLVAGVWLIYRLTDSAFLLGLFVFALNFPVFVLSPIAGVVADRFDRLRLLSLVQVLAMVQAMVVAFLVLSGLVQVWHLILLAGLLGIVNAFEFVTRQSFISELVDDPKDLGNAIALNASIFNGSRLIGPAIAGVLIAFFGEGICFVFNAVTFIPIIILLKLMRVETDKRTRKEQRGLASFLEGLRYAYDFLPIRLLLMLLIMVSLLGGVFNALLPIFAKVGSSA